MPDITRKGNGDTPFVFPHKEDPSILTTQALQREVQNIDKELRFRQSVREREQENLRILIETKIDAREDFVNEQIRAIQHQLEVIERQRVEQKDDTKAAVDAALISQKEAVREQTIASGTSIAKSEAATQKQIDQMAVTFSTSIQAVSLSVTDLKDNWNASLMDMKERIGRIENMRLGAMEQKQEVRSNMGAIYGMGGFVLVLLTILVTLAGTGIFSKAGA